MTIELITKAELSRRAKVSKPAVTKACNELLASALVDKKINVNHPLVQEYIARNLERQSADKTEKQITAPGKAKAKKPAGKAGSTGTRKKTTAKSSGNKLTNRPPSEPGEQIDLSAGYQHDLDLEAIGELTVSEAVKRFGSAPGMKNFLASVKLLAEIKNKEIQTEEKRGTLIRRDFVTGFLLSLIDESFSRLVADVPESVTQQIIARVQAGGDDTDIEVADIIRVAISKVLKDTKASTISQLQQAQYVQ